MMHDCGAADVVDAYREITAPLKLELKANGVLFDVIYKMEWGHHPQVENPSPIVDFILRVTCIKKLILL